MYGGASVEGVAGGKGGMNPMKGADLVDADAQSAMKEAMAQYASRGDNSKEIDDDDADGVKAADDAPIVRLANTIIQQAIKERASDIPLSRIERAFR